MYYLSYSNSAKFPRELLYLSGSVAKESHLASRDIKQEICCLDKKYITFHFY